MNRLAPWLAWALIGCDAIDDVGAPDAGVDGGVVATAQAPPLSGGTLEGSLDGRTVVAGDADRQRVYVVEVGGGMRQFEARAPGRVTIGDDAAYIVQLGGGLLRVPLGEVADAVDAQRVLRTCEGPRGVAWHAGRVMVACLGGELVEVDPDGGPPRLVARLGADLRDVVWHADAWWVSRFRAAELWRVDDAGVVTPVPLALPAAVGDVAARVGWRLRAMPGDRLGFLFQLHSQAPLAAGHDAYATSPDRCDGAVQSALAVFDAEGAVVRFDVLAGVVLAVDFAVAGATIALAAPGNAEGGLHRAHLDIEWAPWDHCARAEWIEEDGRPTDGQFVAVAALGDALVAQRRDPGAIEWYPPPGRDARAPAVLLDARPVGERGHDLFHLDAGGGVACASCHPLGGDDGHVWRLGDLLRRTLSLRGAVSETAPYHWAGEFADLAALLGDVFEGRMGGAALSPEDVEALTRWLDGVGLPRYAVPHPDDYDAAAHARGEAAFERACADCHRGPHLTDNAMHDVAGGRLATPPLRELWLRGTLFHAGCSATAGDAAAFFECAEAAHGAAVSDEWRLTPAERVDLFELVKTL